MQVRRTDTDFGARHVRQVGLHPVHALCDFWAERIRQACWFGGQPVHGNHWDSLLAALPTQIVICTYSAKPDSEACTPCPAGFASATEGATSSATCMYCLSNTVALVEGTAVCMSCPANAIDVDRQVGERSCSLPSSYGPPCFLSSPLSFQQPYQWMPACTRRLDLQDCACAAGYTVTPSSSTGLGFECSPCPVGHYSDQQNATGAPATSAPATDKQ